MAVWVLVVVLVLVVLAALVLRRRAPTRTGGRAPPTAATVSTWRRRAASHRASDNVVVDTLNLVHGITGKPPTLCRIIETVETVAPVLKKEFPGRVVFVLKGRTSEEAVPASTRNAYQAAALRNRVHINLVEKSPAAAKGRGVSHAALGRDDFYLVMLAKEYKCAVLTRDKFRDLSDMKTVLPRFYVRMWGPTGRETRDYVSPSAPELRRLPRPARIDPAEVGLP